MRAILTFHSIGDIIFTEPIYRHFWMTDGIKPIVIIRDHLMWIQEYIRSATFQKASVWDGDIDSMSHDPTSLINLRFANQIYRGLDKWDNSDIENCMLDKYRLASIDIERWKDIHLLFNEQKAMELYDLEVRRFCGGEYVCVNEYSGVGNIEIKPKTNLHIVKMHSVAGYSVIDWYLVMAMAKENHHVSTSTFYLFQALVRKYGGKLDTKVFIYPRPNHDVDGLKGISNLNASFEHTLVL